MSTRNRVVAILALSLGAAATSAQDVSDFIFTDDEGHLVLRFVGVAPSNLTAEQREEIVNSEFSTMVHDRLRADLLFESEPVDTHWAHSMEPLLIQYISENAPQFFAVEAECHSASCRLILDHDDRPDVNEHQKLVPVVQDVVESFIATHEHSLRSPFMIAAHYQEPERPYIKVYVPRSVEP